ncbi:MAG: RHS repeat-associated core domain-containing protein [Vampirovibrionales bacterium]|nr:RHS repeat-associated core domain-containing protein [Vampirovibrionales bacterium]
MTWGSTAWLSDANGAFQTRYDYSSYGRLEGSLPNPSATNSLTYTAREDDGTGLMYYRARYYDPSLERFISDDPLGDGQRYVEGNSVALKDPLGLGPKGSSSRCRYWHGIGSRPRSTSRRRRGRCGMFVVWTRRCCVWRIWSAEWNYTGRCWGRLPWGNFRQLPRRSLGRDFFCPLYCLLESKQ